MQFTIDADHPALPGHFPGYPVVPGVVILSHVLAALRGRIGASRMTGIRRLKFLRQVMPGQPLRIVIDSPKPQAEKPERVGFECWSGDALVLSGVASIAA